MREFWEDSDLHLRLTAEERELYVGLWMLADDAGWLPRDVEGIGAALFRFVDRDPRSKRVRSGLERLRDLGKVQTFRCCIHLPAVEKYPRAGKKSRDHEIEHRFHAQPNRPRSKRPNDIQSDSKPSPVPSLPVPTLPDVTGAQARKGETTEFRAGMAAAGVRPELTRKGAA